MSASLPEYRVIVLTAGGLRCTVTGAVTGLSLEQGENELAQRLSLSLYNLRHQGKLLSELFRARDRVFVYASQGQEDREVFRGYLWDHHYRSETEKLLTWTCYDNLIYLQESEDSLYYASGQRTAGVFASICKRWGIPLEYRYDSITHGNLALRGTLSNLMLSDLLEPVRKQTGRRYVMRGREDALWVERAGSNETVCSIKSRANALRTESDTTMAGMVTRVIITGKTGKNGQAPVEATLSRGTEQYGTLQKVLASSDAESLAEARKEAEELLEEKSRPAFRASVEAVDIPYLRKGDQVELAAGNLLGRFLVLGISHDGLRKTMRLEVERFG